MKQKCFTYGNLTFLEKEVFCKIYYSYSVNLRVKYATNFIKNESLHRLLSHIWNQLFNKMIVCKSTHICYHQLICTVVSCCISIWLWSTKKVTPFLIVPQKLAMFSSPLFQSLIRYSIRYRKRKGLPTMLLVITIVPKL